MTFGKRRGGGRRAVERVAVPLPATVSSVLDTWRVELIDLSCTGARLKGSCLPPKGEYVAIMIDGVRKFASVAWATRRQCGLAFEEPLLGADVARLWRESTTRDRDLWLDSVSR
jgi:hypothetical protein